MGVNRIFIHQGHNPEERLDILLSSEAASESEVALDALYITALELAGKWNDATFCKEFQFILGAILAIRNLLTLDRILGLKWSSLHTISRFCCVLHWTDSDPVHNLHPSFSEFFVRQSATWEGNMVC